MVKLYISAILIVLALNCGCGGGEGDSSGEPPTPQQDIPSNNDNNSGGTQGEVQTATLNQEVSAQCPDDDAVSVTFVASQEGSTLLSAIVKINAKSAVFSYGFYVKYDPAIVMYRGYQNGEFLGAAVNTLTAEMNSNEGAASTVFPQDQKLGKVVVVGSSRYGYETVGRSGTGELITLEFSIVKPAPAVAVFDFARGVISEKTDRGNTPFVKTSCMPKHIQLTL